MSVETTSSINKTARIAGLLYLLLAIFGGGAEFLVRQSMVVPGDAAATAANILAAEWTFRLGFLAELTGQVVFIYLVMALYSILKPVNRYQAVLMVTFVVIAVTITCLNMLNQFAALFFLGEPGYLAVFNGEQLQALALLFLNMHKVGYLIAQVFFGLWLLPLGILVYKSGFFPRLLGILLVVACAGYLADVVIFTLFPAVDLVLSEFTFIGELLLLFWLLVKGVNVEQWETQALAPASQSA